ncbi:MAG: tRNA lysidine(34) synthetase TilS, partial [Terriglobia bacterium]
CSGGADSVALLLLLDGLQEKLGLRLLVAHLNHGLRGPEADADQAFVGRLAERLNVEFIAERAEVAALAGEKKINLEEAGRQARLAVFARLVDDGRADAVALAHTLDDQAETVLGRIVRGAGTRGLAGIHPIVEAPPTRVHSTSSGPGATSGLRLVRPLLGVRRAELRDYLAGREQPWREDTSNLDRARLRSRLRQDLLPRLSPTAIRHLGRLAEHARQEEAFWSAFIEERFRDLASQTGEECELTVAALRAPVPGFPPEAQRAVARRLIRRALEATRGTLRRLTQSHIEGVLRLAERGQSGQRVELPAAVVERQFDRLVFRPGGPARAAPEPFALRVAAPGRVRLPGGGALDFKLVAVAELETRYNECSSAADAARARFPLVVRNWQPGDAFQPAGARRRKKLKALFLQQRLPAAERGETPVVVCGGEILWVARLGIAAPYGLSSASRTALLIEERTER